MENQLVLFILGCGVLVHSVPVTHRGLMERLNGMSEYFDKQLDEVKSELLSRFTVMDTKLTQLMARRQRRRRHLKKDTGLKCPEGFKAETSLHSCYKFSNFPTEWNEARKYCGIFNSNLLSLDSEREEYMTIFLAQENKELAGVREWWTGGTYVAQNSQWMWTTQRHVRPFRFSNWKTRQDILPGKRCLSLARVADGGHEWQADDCKETKNFICEAN